MTKTFHFLAGLPRTGTTLLTAILNQHPDIYASPQTDLLQMMYLLETNIPSFESYQAGLCHQGYDSALRSLAESFYADVDKPVVIDKNRAWGTPYNLHLAAIVNPAIRIIATVRPVLEILASFVVQARAHPGNNFIDAHMARTDFFAAQYRDIEDARCDWLMRPGGDIDQSIFGSAQARVYPEWFHLVTYDHMVTDTAATMAGIYEFLGLDPCDHDFDHVRAIDAHDDEAAFGLPDLHHVRERVARQSPSPEDILSDYVIDKYAGSDTPVLPRS